MASPISANKAELLAIATSVATEKMIDKAIVVEAMEEAIQKAARARYGAENDIRAKLDPVTGDLRLWRVVEVVEEVEDYFKQVDLKQAEKLEPGSKLGDFIVDPLPPIDLGRIDAQSAKQVIFQKVRDAERERQFEEFKDRASEIITGVIKSVEFGHVIVNLGRAEGVIRRDQQIPREAARVGERVRALILKVERNNRGPQIFLSRAHPEFMKKLFAQEVPEIYDGIIEIKAAARDPGSRAKIGVISRDSSIDPVGACVGMKGSRVQAVVQELQGEKIDIIPWSEDTATFVVNALQPATVSRVVLDEEESRIEVVVPDDQLSLAIGRRGQNVRLASQLTESQIDIMTEEEASEKRQREFAERSKMFEEELDVDETLSQLLVAEGFGELEEVAYVDLPELAGIEGFDDELAEELQNRAREALERQEEAHRATRRELGVEDALAEIPHLTEQMLVVLGKAGIKTLDDLADLATDELIPKKREAPRRRNPEAGPPLRRPQRAEDKGGVLGEFGLSEEQGNEIIMAARAHWFEDEDVAPAAAEPAAEEAADAEIPHNEPVVDHDIADARGAGDGPERRCVLSGRIAARDELLRLAVSPEGDVLPDALARAPGRGAWIGVSGAELAAALANGKLKGGLARAFKNARLAIPDDLPQRMMRALERAFLDRLGLEMRSGKLILGSDRIAAEARMGKVAALYHAADASEDGARKLDQAWRVGRDEEGTGLSGLRLPLDRTALSVALGRDNVVHLALADRASAERIAVPLRRLVNFLGAAPASLDEDAMRAGDKAAPAGMATN